MLRFKKMAAVLLAAAMALVMFTACGSGGSSSSENQELTNSVNKILKEKGYTKTIKYDPELDKKADLYYTTNIDLLNKDWQDSGLDRKMFQVRVPETEKANTAEKIVDAINPSLTDLRDDWNIGYHVEIQKDKDQKVTSRDIYIILEWTDKN